MTWVEECDMKAWSVVLVSGLLVACEVAVEVPRSVQTFKAKPVATAAPVSSPAPTASPVPTAPPAPQAYPGDLKNLAVKTYKVSSKPGDKGRFLTVDPGAWCHDVVLNYEVTSKGFTASRSAAWKVVGTPWRRFDFESSASVRFTSVTLTPPRPGETCSNAPEVDNPLAYPLGTCDPLLPCIIP